MTTRQPKAANAERMDAMTIDWKTDWEEHTADPGDGELPFCFWWEDMRPREVLDLVQRAFKRGHFVGARDAQLAHAGEIVHNLDEARAILTQVARPYRKYLGLPEEP
jgi:hypothetical protein